MIIADLNESQGREYPARRRTQNIAGGASPLQTTMRNKAIYADGDKTDPIDARDLANLQRGGYTRRVYHTDNEQRPALLRPDDLHELPAGEAPDRCVATFETIVKNNNKDCRVR